MVETEQTLLDEVALLRDELAAIRAALGTRVSIEINAGGSEWLLGQPVTLDVTVRDSFTLQPLPDMPISAVTSWGSLKAVKDARGRQGSAVTTRTGIDGRARLILSPAAAQFVEPQAQTALEAVLNRLDASAPTPALDSAGLAFLTRQYRWEPNVQLRSAVDAYFQFHRNELAAIVFKQDALKRWQTIEATVQIAVLTDSANAGGVALQLLSFKNWIPPWLQSFRQSARQAGELEQQLAQEKKRQKEPNQLLDVVYGRVRGYVDEQYGLVGEYIGQRVAKEALRTFLTEGISDLPDQTKQKLFPAVRIASVTVEREGVNVLSALTQARVDLRQEVDAKVAAIDLSEVKTLGGRVDSLQTTIDGKLDTNAFEAFRLANTAQLEAKAPLAQFEEFQRQTTAGLKGKVNVGTFNSFQQNVNGRFDKMVVRDEFEGFGAEVTAALSNKVDEATFSQIQETNKAQLEAKAPLEQFEEFKEQTTAGLSRKVNNGTFNSFQQTVNSRFDQFVVRDEFKGFSAEVTELLNDKVGSETFAEFNGEMGARLKTKADLERMVELERQTTEALNRKVDVNRFNTFERRVDDRLSNMTTRSTFDLFQEEMVAALDQKVSASEFQSFQEANEIKLSGKVDQASFSELNRELSLLQTNVKKLDQNVVRIGSNVRMTPGVTIRPIFR